MASAPIRVISFFLLATCVALCQSEHPTADLLQGLQFVSSSSPQVQRPEIRLWRSLPDAPSVLPPTKTEKFHTFIEEARSPYDTRRGWRQRDFNTRNRIWRHFRGAAEFNRSI